MEITEEPRGNAKLFRLQGRLDSNTSPALEERLVQAVTNGTRSVVIDFKHLDYISSAGLRVILKTAKALKRENGKLLLCCMQDYVKEVFEIAGFDSLLPILASREEALRQL